MNVDHGILNVPLAKRGNIDAQIDAYKREQAKLAKEENIKADRSGVPHLHKGGMIRVFANRTQAERAASRTGGEAYQSSASNRFMVRFAAQTDGTI
jgi:hypothetical protein